MLSGKPQIHRYKSYHEKGKKEEYKENFTQAIKHYQDALFYLENDYLNLKKSDDRSRQKLIEGLKEKVDVLKEKTTTNNV